MHNTTQRHKRKQQSREKRAVRFLAGYIVMILSYLKKKNTQTHTQMRNQGPGPARPGPRIVAENIDPALAENLNSTVTLTVNINFKRKSETLK